MVERLRETFTTHTLSSPKFQNKSTLLLDHAYSLWLIEPCRILGSCSAEDFKYLRPAVGLPCVLCTLIVNVVNFSSNTRRPFHGHLCRVLGRRCIVFFVLLLCYCFIFFTTAALAAILGRIWDHAKSISLKQIRLHWHRHQTQNTCLCWQNLTNYGSQEDPVEFHIGTPSWSCHCEHVVGYC